MIRRFDSKSKMKMNSQHQEKAKRAKQADTSKPNRTNNPSGHRFITGTFDVRCILWTSAPFCHNFTVGTSDGS